MSEKEIENSEIFAKNLKLNILELAYYAGSSSSHFGGALSIVDIVSVIFSNHYVNDSKKKISLYLVKDMLA